ncbi:rhodanese-like domain-containing protein [Chitiniphilus eburneus]|uniref:Rhodanese-like domain-containing protein n=1 Tax=Chitiniphilus eburneus TaxID=2571148 RepID=A0A4U0Q4L2_9NEIS|nr:rhodanese-like domain-containing protein [Chitiniphilus eburneus]TJZ75650.1 rhodanese-like domain-containing protein [Chitiniphilus eburneus]
MDAQLQHYANKLAYEIDAWDLSEALRAGQDVIVVDARSPSAYAREHIPGAINLPHRSMDHATTAHLDRATLYVSYCDGIGCNASTKGAYKLAQLGFTVKELMGGLDWWKRDGYATAGDAATCALDAEDCGCAG